MEGFDIDKVTVEPFTIQYIADVREIHYPVLDGWSMKSLISDLANNSTMSYIAVYEGRALGFCSYLVTDDAELQFICTHQMYRRQGICSKLLTETIGKLPPHINSIVLEVRSQNDEAIQLYKKLGFQYLGTRRNFYTTPIDDALVMEYTKGVKELN